MLEVLYTEVAAALSAIPADLARDVYAVSLFVNDEDDDPRLPTVTVGYNTVDHWRSSTPDASSPEEARWNYAFWLQNRLAVLGGSSSPLRPVMTRWLRERGLWFSDDEEQSDGDRCLELAGEINSAFVSACCETVQQLHDRGLIERVFGRPIPVLVHELEYYDEIAAQNEDANPPGLCEEFASWVRAG